MAEKRSIFGNRWLPYLLIGPQIGVTVVFFVWPAAQALYQSVLVEDAFGLNPRFAGLTNFIALFHDPAYVHSFRVTFVFSVAVAVSGIAISLALAVLANRPLRGLGIYKICIIWPYAVSPAIAGVLWLFLFNPTVGIIADWLGRLGVHWNYLLNSGQALFLCVVAAVWKHISYNFLFFLAGLQSIPKSLIEAAAIDGAGPVKRFWTIVFPLLSPTTFFLLVINMVYAFFDTFGVIDAITQGGPAEATNILVYKVYHDGFQGLDLGGSAAQSVILMAIVVTLVIIQFRFVERRVTYA
ncbi:MAG TPA: sn-glycerol-3-phosphate ABC transporter permease UgpA [Burkholderiales bacterium]|nr:sn-glycerol-3-phosphate ABC transporter permease UgpA [Burkholderiales bacterium]